MIDAVEEVRRALLRVHRAIVDAERVAYERRHGSVTGPAFLRALLDDLRYDWLRQLSELVIRFDEAQEAAEGGAELPDEQRPEALFAAVRALLVPPDSGTAFGRRYGAVLQREPDAVVAHGALVRVLPPPPRG